jgi:hypothetical protein
MASTYEDRGQASRAARERERQYDLARRDGHAGPGLGLPIAGIAALGLAGLAWYYFGPDLRRYLKLRSM